MNTQHHLQTSSSVPFTRLLSLLALFLCLSQNAFAAPKAVVIADEDKVTHLTPSYHKISSNGVTLHLVSFDSRDYQLQVIDQAGGPGSKWRDCATLGKSKGALAAINAGFFTPEGGPLGKVITNGSSRGSNNSSSLGSGFYFKNSTQSGIARRNTLQRTLKKLKPTELLQSGPMLSYRGSTVKGLSNTRPRPRSFIASNGSYHWVIGYAEYCTLAQLSASLAGRSLADIHIYHALNLDGGRSSDLWISPKVLNGDRTFRALWNKPVRNFLVLTKK